jgi:hypothetical protein
MSSTLVVYRSSWSGASRRLAQKAQSLGGSRRFAIAGLQVGATWPEIADTAVELLGLHQDAAGLPLIQMLELSHAKLFMSRSL